MSPCRSMQRLGLIGVSSSEGKSKDGNSQQGSTKGGQPGHPGLRLLPSKDNNTERSGKPSIKWATAAVILAPPVNRGLTTPEQITQHLANEGGCENAPE